MADKRVAFLPKSSNQDYQPPARGLWTGHEARVLTKIADDFAVLDGQESPHSIPDVWKRPLIFADTLCRIDVRQDDKLSPFEKRIRGEWRGMLGILAFWGSRGWDWLKAEVVAFPAPGEEKKPGFVEVLKPGFMKVLHELRPDRPKELILSGVNWQCFHVLLGLDQQPFGLISPMSLVCTAEDYTGRLAGVPWFTVDPKTRKSFLTDPLVGPHLGSREKKWLAQWIAYVRTEIERLGQTNTVDSRKDGIVTQLGKYETEANGGVKAAPYSTANLLPTGIALVNSPNPQLTNKLYKLLEKPIDNTGAESEVEVLKGATVASTNRYFLIEPSLEDQWNRPAREIIVYGYQTLADPVPNPRVAAALIPRTNNCFWCTKDFFLEKRIIVFTEPGALPGSHSSLSITGAGRRTPIPPIRKEALGLIAVKTLAEKLTLEWIGETIVARLSVSLQQSGTDGETQECVIERLYQGEDILEVDGADVPVAKIWPNFTAPQWNIYHTYVALTGRDLHMQPYPPAEAAATRDYTASGQGFAMYQTTCFPEALVCTLQLDSAGPQRQEQVCAVLPLQPPDALPTAAIATGAVVGVDFGSTGSIVFRKPEAGDPKEFTIQPRLFSVTKESLANALRTDRDFLPNEARESNDILSVFQVHGDAGGDQFRLPFCDGHILYLQKTPEQFIDESTRNVKTNLKWGGAHETYLSASFIEQLCLQTAAECRADGASMIEWRFSYPTAFSRQKVGQFGVIWGSISKKIQSQTGVTSSLAPEGQNLEFCEAVCTARYFRASLKMSATAGALSIDIGGGTSDYAFWRDDTLTMHNSVLLAGRDIFLAALREQPKFLATLDKSLNRVVADILRLREKDRNAANAQIDAIIARKGDNLQHAMAIGHEEEAVKGFRRLVEIGISGILYYGGLLVRHQVEASENPFDPREFFGIYAGGNGSKLFHWAFGHTFKEDSAEARRLGEVFKTASGLKVNIEIRLSEKPKSEVGYGLVAKVPTDRSLKIGGQLAGLLACESSFSGKKQFNWKESPSTEELRTEGLEIDPDLPEFSKFLKAIGCTLTSVQREELVRTVNDRLATLFSPAHLSKSDQEAETVLPRGEPVWILAFKAFLEDQIHVWAQSV
jgi:hypothetical protein